MIVSVLIQRIDVIRIIYDLCDVIHNIMIMFIDSHNVFVLQ